MFYKKRDMHSPMWRGILVSTSIIIAEHFKRALYNLFHLPFFTYSLSVIIALYMLSPYFHFRAFYFEMCSPMYACQYITVCADGMKLIN